MRSWGLRLGFVSLLLLALLPAGARAARHVPGLRLSRPARAGGCCSLQIDHLAPNWVKVTDTVSGFSAAAGPFLLGRSHLPGAVLLWVLVSERNQASVADALVSGPRNWLLLARDGPHPAFAAVPPRRAGKPLARVNALVADTNPENDGWIAFRLPAHSGPRFTLLWSDCRPRCDQSVGVQAYAPVVDLYFNTTTSALPSVR